MYWHGQMVWSVTSHFHPTISQICNLLGGSALITYIHLSQHSTFTVGGLMPQLGEHHLLHPT